MARRPPKGPKGPDEPTDPPGKNWSKIEEIIEKLAPHKSAFRRHGIGARESAIETIAYLWEVNDEINNAPRKERDEWAHKIASMGARSIYTGMVQYYLGYDKSDMRRDTALSQFIRNMGGALDYLVRNFRPHTVDHAVVVHELTRKNKTISELASENSRQRNVLAEAAKVQRLREENRVEFERQAELAKKARDAGFNTTEEYVLNLDQQATEARYDSLRRIITDHAEPVASAEGDFTFYAFNKGQLRKIPETMVRKLLSSLEAF